MPVTVENATVDNEPSRSRWRFPGAVTTLAIVTLLVWIAAIFIPPGQYQRDADGSPIPGTFEQIESSLTAGERIEQLLLAPVNGVYGLLSPERRIVDTEVVGRLYGKIVLIVFIMPEAIISTQASQGQAIEVPIRGLPITTSHTRWPGQSRTRSS